MSIEYGGVSMLDTDILFDYINQFGEIKHYRIIDSFQNNDKNYIIYKEEGTDDLLADLYEVVHDNLNIIHITDESDYDVVDEYLENL